MSIMNKEKKNNLGFTLVELLVAVAILAIVVGPLLYAFVISAETNTKSRKFQAATTVAQNLEEAVQALKLEDLAYEVNYPSDESLLLSKSNFAGSQELLQREGRLIPATRKEDLENQEDISLVNASVIKTAEGYKYLGQDSGVYYFSVEGIKSQNFNFDALIKLDASVYREGTSKKNHQDEPLNFNSRMLSEVANLNDQEDAFYVQKTSDNIDTQAAEEFVRRNIVFVNETGNQDIKRDLTYFEINITRTIKIDISNNGSLSVVKVTYEYSAPNGTVSPGEEKVAYENTIYNNSESGARLRGVYLFYIPLYKLPQGTSTTRDKIIISNEDNLKTNLYIIKQEYGLPVSTLQLREEQYKIDLLLYESSDSQSLIIKTNLDTNLCTLFDDNYENASLKQASYYYYKNNVLDSSKDISIAGITETSTGDAIYDLEIYIYQAGALEGDHYDEGKLLTTFTGSKYE